MYLRQQIVYPTIEHGFVAPLYPSLFVLLASVVYAHDPPLRRAISAVCLVVFICALGVVSAQLLTQIAFVIIIRHGSKFLNTYMCDIS